MKMKRKLIITATLLCVTLLVPLSLFSQENILMSGTELISYKGNAANVTIPAGVTAIGYRAFEDSRGLTNINIPSSVTSIGVGAFSGCVSLSVINIPRSVTSIGNFAFIWCFSLKSIIIPSSVISIGNNAFLGCDNLRTVTVSRRTRIGENAFPANTQITYSD